MIRNGKDNLIELPLGSNLVALKKSYKVRRERLLGELDLAAIAKEALREYCWVFDLERNLWYYWPQEKYECLIDKSNDKTEARLTLPLQYYQPISNHSVFYHIHPDFLVAALVDEKESNQNRNFLMASNQKPTAEDLELQCKVGGYKEFCIVTTFGVTTCIFHPPKYSIHFPRLNISKQELNPAMEQGLEEGINVILGKMNQHYKMTFELQFRKFPSYD